MKKNIDLQNRIVELWEVETSKCEDEIVSYLDRKMKVRFHDAVFNHINYVFIGKPHDAFQNTITVSGYRKKLITDKYLLEIG
jgi:hypothetical protein